MCNAVREAENKLKWRERVAGSVLPNGHCEYGIGARCKVENDKLVKLIKLQIFQQSLQGCRKRMELILLKYISSHC